MTRSKEHCWLNRFAWFTATATFLLIGLGGLVTSKGAGMAVPDWPTMYGYNMFLFPFHLWTGGIFYEHTHRLLASFVGMLTVTLAVWVWLRDPRRWLRWLALGAVFAVVLQGVLGGLRVTLYKDQIGIFHAALAQSFFVLTTVLAFCLSGTAERWIQRARECKGSILFSNAVVAGTVLVFVQLILGASMRHQHAGLAVPDFPLAYGKLWPPTDSAFIDRVNQQRTGVEDFKPITAGGIYLHMAHRLGAVLILLCVASATVLAIREQRKGSLARRVITCWLGVVLFQAVLGALTVWSNKAADIATAHVLVGALSLVVGVLASLLAVAAKESEAVRVPNFTPARAGGMRPAKLGSHLRVDEKSRPHPPSLLPPKWRGVVGWAFGST